jgi:hypothetical protein
MEQIINNKIASVFALLCSIRSPEGIIIELAEGGTLQPISKLSYRRKPVSSDFQYFKSTILNSLFTKEDRQRHWIPGQARNDDQGRENQF